MASPEIFVTNFNPRFTGVSATAAAVFRRQAQGRAALVGQALPGCPDPITLSQARALSRTAPKGRPFAIWHLRRNPEMRAGIWARDILRLPIRLVFTSAAQRLHSAYPRWLISRMDAVIATTEKAVEFVPHVKAVVPHGVDTDHFRPATDHDAAFSDQGYGGERGIATIGRIRPEKGTDRFVDAMLAILPRHPDVTALVVGRAGPAHRSFLSDLKARVAAAGLSDRLLFPGEIAAEELPALLRSLSLLVALPRYEGYGMTPLEAMASAVPFIATDTGYFREFSGSGTAGVILDDPAAAAQDISALLSAPDRLAAMSHAARDRACSHYSLDGEHAGISAVYERLWSEA